MSDNKLPNNINKALNIKQAITKELSRWLIASINTFPIPGQINTDSKITAPENNDGMYNPSNVTKGICAFLNACL